MNKFEILFKLSDTADRLESAGLLREAIVLTNVMKRMAGVKQPWDQEEPDYYNAIQEYKANIKNNQHAKSIYDKYYTDMTNLINIPNNPNKRELQKRLRTFELQVEKLKAHEKPMQNYTGSIGMENNALANQINYYGLERAKDLNDFNRRWQLYMDQQKNIKYENIPNGKEVYYMPGMQQYFANLYEQLKLKYIK